MTRKGCRARHSMKHTSNYLLLPIRVYSAVSPPPNFPLRAGASIKENRTLVNQSLPRSPSSEKGCIREQVITGIAYLQANVPPLASISLTDISNEECVQSTPKGSIKTPAPTTFQISVSAEIQDKLSILSSCKFKENNTLPTFNDVG